jgi:hypothetical protein
MTEASTARKDRDARTARKDRDTRTARKDRDQHSLKGHTALQVNTQKIFPSGPCVQNLIGRKKNLDAANLFLKL